MIADDPVMIEGLPRYLNNAKLKAAGAPMNLTMAQLQEMQMIIKDPIYFIERYCMIISVDDGYIPFKMYEYQRDMIRLLNGERKIIALLPRQSGKCQEFKTRITLRNKKTGEVMVRQVGEFYESVK